MGSKETAWKYFSKYIRMKECIETTGNEDFGKCCDCGKIYSFDRLDAGHFIPGRTNSVLFVEDNVHIQCHSCNRVRLSKLNAQAGVRVGYLDYMLKRYGEKRVTELIQLKYQPKKITDAEFKEIAREYRIKIKEL